MDVSVRLHVVVDDPPLLQEAMHTQNGPNISCQIATAAGDREVLGGVKTKTVHHEVTISQVTGGKRNMAMVSKP